ncbi:SRPBCC family protein [Streptomyces sp. MST-110588]|nr:SRPBCC family protein [Streptomyces sp. MST-110588]
MLGNPAADRLKEEAAAFAAAQAQRLLISAGERLGRATVKLQDIADGKSPGFTQLAVKGGKKLAEGKGPLRAAVEAGASNVKDRIKGGVKDRFQDVLTSVGGRRKGGGGKGRIITVVEDTDVGVPVREAYNQWTQFQEFSTFAKGVQGVETVDETTSNWRARVWWSTRSWKATTTEQIPDRRIAWTSEGAKGTTKGVVTFHPLGENLTRILLVIEYSPKGLFEKTGNIWRAQGRRARLDLKHFRRFVMMRGEATGEWRGEIRDGEVVLSHDEALEREEARSKPADEEFEDEDTPEEGAQRAEDAEGAEDEEDAEDGYEAEDEDEAEEDLEEDDLADEEPAEEEFADEEDEGAEAEEREPRGEDEDEEAYDEEDAAEYEPERVR